MSGVDLEALPQDGVEVGKDTDASGDFGATEATERFEAMEAINEEVGSVHEGDLVLNRGGAAVLKLTDGTRTVELHLLTNYEHTADMLVVYLPKEGKVTIHLEPGIYDAVWFSAFTGEKVPLPPVTGGEWTSPHTPGWLDWALLLQKR